MNLQSWNNTSLHGVFFLSTSTWLPLMKVVSRDVCNLKTHLGNSVSKYNNNNVHVYRRNRQQKQVAKELSVFLITKEL